MVMTLRAFKILLPNIHCQFGLNKLWLKFYKKKKVMTLIFQKKFSTPCLLTFLKKILFIYF